jgi:DeoR/GlpR family transcriptional regulator of sugar metabolism
VDFAVVEAARGMYADLFLLGVTGVHLEAGLTVGGRDEALAHQAADTYVLAGSEKIGAASRFAMLPLSGVSGVITKAARTTRPWRRRTYRSSIPDSTEPSSSRLTAVIMFRAYKHH